MRFSLTARCVSNSPNRVATRHLRLGEMVRLWFVHEVMKRFPGELGGDWWSLSILVSIHCHFVTATLLLMLIVVRRIAFSRGYR